ncbi:MAG: hypothetical protein ACOYKD_08730 [Anaerolineaceae bacterium]|jgi:hypothetical protein
MNSAQRPTFKEFLPAFFILTISGGIGLAFTVSTMLPTIGPRWLFFFFVVLFVAGLFLPFVYFLNLRFPSRPPADRGVIIRQAVWVGIFVAVLAWLQLGRVLTLPLGIILGAAFILVEVLLRVWERSRWKPNQPN